MPTPRLRVTVFLQGTASSGPALMWKRLSQMQRSSILPGCCSLLLALFVSTERHPRETFCHPGHGGGALAPLQPELRGCSAATDSLL